MTSGVLFEAVLRRQWRAFMAMALGIAGLIAIAAPLTGEPLQIFGGGIGYHLARYCHQTQ